MRHTLGDSLFWPPLPEGKNAMTGRLLAPAFALATLLACSPLAHTQDVARQPGAVYDFDRKGEKPAPAPKHDLSGVWEPAGGPSAGVQATGAGQMPSDGKPEHE